MNRLTCSAEVERLDLKALGSLRVSFSALGSTRSTQKICNVLYYTFPAP
ncbi:MAG: hypothetical protein QG602_2743 [Verrucomicrobiota bacterium]|nr:hypothetical protein [Verrucomicrobiota bacterium]